MTGYPAETIYEEVAFIAYYLHWPREQIMALDNRERRTWVAQISRINKQMNESERVEA
jgi:hypothetical protein